MLNKMTDYEWFVYEMKNNGLDKYILSSHKEAKESKMENSLVIIPDEENKYFDVYVTGFQGGKFGEYVCWVDDEFNPETADTEELLYDVIWFIKETYLTKNITEKIFEVNPNLYFTEIDKV